MNKRKIEKLRKHLREMADRIQSQSEALEEQARTATGGDSGGNLSNAPMHLADLGTAVYIQELNATILENETHLRAEVLVALDRMDQGMFGICENCQGAIPLERLEAIPYTRYCTPCAEAVQSGVPVNLNQGRPRSGADTLNPHDDDRPRKSDTPGHESDQAPFTNLTTHEDPQGQDIHAVGSAGGGTAIGGLAGTNIGDGDPDDAALEDALGSGNFDVALDGQTQATDSYAGASGGAVGGTPAGKRSVGGKLRRSRNRKSE